MAGDALQPVLRHEAAGSGVALAAPIQLVERKIEGEAARGLLQRAYPLRHDLTADAVTSDHSDMIG